MKNNVVAVTVTYNRTELLEKTVESLVSQTFNGLDKIVIVDNSSNETHLKKLKEIEKISDKIDIVYCDENLGGAGGFYIGMKHALEKYNPNWYWIMDDDAYPTPTCLDNLMEYSDKYDNIGFLAPFIYGITNKEYQLYHHKKISKYKNEDIQYIQKYENAKQIDETIEATAFVGPLISKLAVEAIGLPDKGLFIYGDDTEYTYRISRKLNAYLVKDAVINHEDPPVIKDKGILNPKQWWKDYYAIRNRSLFISKYGENAYIKFVGKSILVGTTVKWIASAIIKSNYKGYKKARVYILSKAVKDSIFNNTGKTIDPAQYIKSLEK